MSEGNTYYPDHRGKPKSLEGTQIDWGKTKSRGNPKFWSGTQILRGEPRSSEGNQILRGTQTEGTQNLEGTQSFGVEPKSWEGNPDHERGTQIFGRGIQIVRRKPI